jgi:hypothetical protein
MILITKVALGLGAALALSTGYVFHEGVMRVDVDESRSGGSHVHFWVPATTVSLGLRVVPRRYLEKAAAQSRPYLPELRELSKELEKYPNAELLDVKQSSEHVHLAVRNGKLYLDAVSNTDTVHVSFPTETLVDLADRLEDAAPGV